MPRCSKVEPGPPPRPPLDLGRRPLNCLMISMALTAPATFWRRATYQRLLTGQDHRSWWRRSSRFAQCRLCFRQVLLMRSWPNRRLGDAMPRRETMIGVKLSPNGWKHATHCWRHTPRRRPARRINFDRRIDTAGQTTASPADSFTKHPPCALSAFHPRC
jgi:hypothetical protein